MVSFAMGAPCRADARVACACDETAAADRHCAAAEPGGARRFTVKARSALRWLVHLLRARAACLLLLHALRVAWHVFRYRIAPYFAWPFGFLRSHRQCLTVWPSAIPALAPRVAL